MIHHKLFFLVLFLFIPFTAQGKIASVKSGSWNDPSTWSGSVPSVRERVIITAGHDISIPAEGAICKTLDIRTVGNLWSVISGNGKLTISDGGTMKNISFQNTGGVRIPLASKGKVTLEHCTFTSMAMLHIGTQSKTPTANDIVISHCDFNNVFGTGKEANHIVKIDGRQGSHNGNLIIADNTFVGIDGGQGIRIQRRDGAKITNNVFIDSCILQLDQKTGTISSSGGHMVAGNLFAHVNDTGMGSGNRVIYIIPNERPVTMTENYMYDVHWNDHTVTGGSLMGQNVIRKNIFEYGPDTKEANAIALTAVPLLVEENILIGSATLVSNVGNHSSANETLVRKNITYNNGKVVPALFLSENGMPTYPLRFEQNIAVLGKYAFLHNGNPRGRVKVQYSDKNIFWKIKTPYHPTIAVLSGQSGDTVTVNPQLTDPARGFLSYYTHVEGSPPVNAQMVADKFALLNGYDSETKQQNSPSKNYNPGLLRKWVAFGFGSGVIK